MAEKLAVNIAWVKGRVEGIKSLINRGDKVLAEYRCRELYAMVLKKIANTKTANSGLEAVSLLAKETLKADKVL